MKQKLENLDGLRGLMALWVVLGHAVTLAALPFDAHAGFGRLIANGTAAVSVFIILSGFVITLLLQRQKETYGAFLTRRFFRLFPVYWLALALSIAAMGWSEELLRGLPWAHPKNAERLLLFAEARDNFWAHLGLHVGLLHGLVPERMLPGTSNAFMGQAWSLTLEWQFYLVVPFLLWLLHSSGRRFLGPVLVLALCFLGATIEQTSFLLTELHLFAAGILSFHFWQQQRSGTLTPGAFVQIMCLLGLALSPQKALLIPWVIWVTALCSQTMAPAGFSVLGIVDRVLSHRVVRWIGEISYPIYCLHMVVLYTTGHVVLDMLHLRHHAAYATILITGGMVITILLSWVVHRWVEQPMMDFGKRIVSRQRRVAVDAVVPAPSRD